MEKSRMLVFEPVPEDDQKVIFRGWIEVGDLVDDPSKYEYVYAPSNVELTEDNRFKMPLRQDVLADAVRAAAAALVDSFSEREVTMVAIQPNGTVSLTFADEPKTKVFLPLTQPMLEYKTKVR